MESGEDFITTHTLENGSSPKPMVTVCTPGKTEIVMKGNGTCV